MSGFPPPLEMLESFIPSLWSDSTIVAHALVSGTPSDAEICVKRHRDRDGLICHYFSGSVMDQMTRSATHTFLVAPGLWASEIIREFGDFLKGPLFDGVDDESTYISGGLGVVFEMPCSDAFVKLKSLQPGCHYRLVRFFSVR